MRKGVSLPTVMAILAVVISAMFIGISSDIILKPENYIRSNSVFMVSDRISSSAYAMDSMERADMQLDLGDEYKFEKDTGDDSLYIIYGDNSEKVEPGVGYSSETGSAEKICISKHSGSNPSIEMGGC